MSWWRRLGTCVLLAAFSGAAFAADPDKLIDIDNANVLHWSAYRSQSDTCVLSGKAVSEMRDDAFDVQFRHSRGQTLLMYVLIPGLPKGGSVFIEAPTTRDRWKISTNNYVPALSGERAEAIRRNVAAGIPIEFTFEYGKNARTRYETAPHRAVNATAAFMACIDQVTHEVQEVKQ